MDSIASGKEPVSKSAENQPAILPSGSKALDKILKVVVAHAPHKQVVAKSGTSNPKIGRTPGSACEVIRFLSRYARTNRADKAVERKVKALADWVIGLQSRERGRPRHGGVPSTPDLPAPANSYYYAVDAAFCGDAMYRVYELTGVDRYLASAVAFSDFLVAMQAGPERVDANAVDIGFCEYVVDSGTTAAWNCRRYVKVLVALPVLKKVASAKRRRRYEVVARSARKFLVAGLDGAWEFAETKSPRNCGRSRGCATWQRVPGPQKQPNFFVYGDTLAYALRGLFEYEGLTNDVRRLYDHFSSFTGTDPKSRAYDGRIAFAGYIRPAANAPDEFSAYYDLVTLGILHELRRAHRADHFEVANAALAKVASSASSLSWRMNFDLSVPAADYVDLTTLANLGEALLVAR